MSDANLKFVIDSDESKAVDGMLKLETAERKLEIAVKAGNQTLKLRANSEADLAKILPAVAAAEGRVATAVQKRAAASLAAQKSSALLKQMTDAERAAAIEAARVMEESAKRQRIAQLARDSMRSATALSEDMNFKRTQKRMADMARAVDAEAGVFEKGAASAATFALGLTGIGTVAGAASVALNGFSAAYKNQLELAKRSDTEGGAMKDLVSALPGGAEGEAALKQITMAGAKHGMKPGDTAQLAGPLYATADKNSDGKLDKNEQASFDTNLSAGAKLASAGVKPEDASNVILAGDNKGVGGADTAAKLMQAAAISKRGPAEFSKSASAISQFDKLDTGLAVTTALSAAELNPERLPERTKDAQLALSSAADKSNFSKKYQLAGLSQSEKIAKLRKAAVASGDVKKFTDQFQNVPGLDEGKASSLAMLIQQGELYGNTEKALAGTTAKDLDPAITKLRDNPVTGSQMRAADAAALSSANANFGTEASAARDARARSIARGAQMQRYGGSLAVNGDGTEKSLMSSQFFEAIIGRAIAKYNGMPGGLGRDNTPGQQLQDSELEKLRIALEANTEATNANSKSTTSKAPVGGARSNAEEAH